jgi:hypothetical protein
MFVTHEISIGDYVLSQTTCFWQPIYPDEVDKGEFITFSSGKRMAKWYNQASGNGHLRSKTFPGIAKAMALQWG